CHAGYDLGGHREDGDTRQRQDRGAVAPGRTGRWHRRLFALGCRGEEILFGPSSHRKGPDGILKGRVTALTLTFHKFRYATDDRRRLPVRKLNCTPKFFGGAGRVGSSDFGTSGPSNETGRETAAFLNDRLASRSVVINLLDGTPLPSC